MISKLTKEILVRIKARPGIRYRQLLRMTGLSSRKMSFHLRELKKSKLVKTKKIKV